MARRLILRGDVNLVLSLTLVGLFGFPLITPVLPVMRDALHIPTEQIGWVSTAYALPGFIFFPILGYLGDRYGKMRVIAPFGIAFGLFGAATAFVDSFEGLIVMRLLQGAAGSALAVLNVALVADLYAGQERRTVMGYLAAVQNGGSGVLPILGGSLALIAWYAPFIFYLAVIPVVLLALWKLEVAAPAPSARSKGFMGEAWRALADGRVLLLLLLASGFIFVGFGAFITYLPIFLTDRFGVNTAVVGLIVSMRVVSGMMVASQFGRLTARFPLRGLVAAGFLLMAVTIATVPWMPGTWYVLISAFGYGAAFSIVRPGLQTAVLDAAPEDLRSTFAAAHGLALRISQTTAPVLAGLLLLLGRIELVYYVGAAICLALMTVALVNRRAFAAPGNA